MGQVSDDAGWGRRTPNWFFRGRAPSSSFKTQYPVTDFLGLDIEQQPGWVFEEFLDCKKKGHGIPPVNDSVIVGKSQIDDRPYDDLTVLNDRAILDCVHAQNGALRGVQDRG